MMLFLSLFFFYQIHAKNNVVSLQRTPSSVDEKTIVLNGKYMASDIQALSFKEANEDNSTLEKKIEERAFKICATLGYKLKGFDKIVFVDFEDRSPSVSYIVSDVHKLKPVELKSYYAFTKIYCEIDIEKLKACQFGTHGSQDVFFIQTRRKDNCTNSN